MKFNVYELKLESKTYRLYDAIDVPNQLRLTCPAKDTDVLMANADGFDFLEAIFKIASADLKENNIIRIKDNSKDVERFHEWYPVAEFHKNIIVYNYQYTQISGKKIKRLLDMLKFSKSRIIDIQIPDVQFDDYKPWKLKNTLNVKNHSNFFVISSNSYGFLYMANEAKTFHDIEDDEEEWFAHAHLFHMTNYEDKLDMRYYYEV